MHDLYINSYKDEQVDFSKCSPCKIISKTTLNDKNRAINLIKNNQYAIVIMAGGNGSRLGFDGPKGCVKVGNRSLFQIYIDRLLKAQAKKGYYPTLPIALDIEPSNYVSNNGGWTKENLTRVCNIVLDGLKDLGYYPMLYTIYSVLDIPLNYSSHKSSNKCLPAEKEKIRRPN